MVASYLNSGPSFKRLSWVFNLPAVQQVAYVWRWESVKGVCFDGFRELRVENKTEGFLEAHACKSLILEAFQISIQWFKIFNL